MKWYGLTGGIACGKSAVTEYLRRSGIPVVDADAIAREVVAPGTAGLKAVLAEFGANLETAQGELDRKKLAELIFAKPELRARLENILHPLIRARVTEIRQQLALEGHLFAVYDIPLLFETHSQKLFDGVLVVTTTLELQKKRMSERNWSEEEVERRLQAQMPLAEKVNQADYVINNSGSLKDLYVEVDKSLAWMKA